MKRKHREKKHTQKGISTSQPTLGAYGWFGGPLDYSTSNPLSPDQFAGTGASTVSSDASTGAVL